MKQVITMMLLTVLLIMSLGCQSAQPAPHWRTVFLNAAMGQATKTEIAKRLGAPINRVTLPEAKEIWTYTLCHNMIYGSAIQGQGTVFGGTRCVSYHLLFNDQGILENFTQVVD